MNYRRVTRLILLIAITVPAVGVGAWTFLASTSTTAEAGPCRCPKLYAPVVCDKGKTYPNQCVADCRHAKNCVPTGIPIAAVADDTEIPEIAEIEEVDSVECALVEVTDTIETDAFAPSMGKGKGKGCKPCKGKKYCTCTYNGFPRTSCEPCCYTNDIGILICSD